MEILSHRGYWKTPAEKNSRRAFERSFELGFGLETDVRDADGGLVISHDPAGSGALALDQFLELYDTAGGALPLAINVKADGLQSLLKSALERHSVKNYFVFDMSIPDTIGYMRQSMPFFSRHSDVEPHPNLYEEAIGIWLDCFYSDWFDWTTIDAHLSAGKKVCIVSPELHGRNHLAVWQMLKSQPVTGLMLCTDYPEDARAYFDGPN